MLDDHFRKEHFTCDEAECKEKRVVFKSLFDLQAHKRQVHSGQSLPGGGSSGDIHGMAPSSNTRTTANASAARGMEEFPSLGGPSHAQSAARSLLSLSPSSPPMSLFPSSLSSHNPIVYPHQPPPTPLCRIPTTVSVDVPLVLLPQLLNPFLAWEKEVGVVLCPKVGPHRD